MIGFRWFTRLVNHPRTIQVLAPATVLALAAAAWAVFGVLAVDQQQERDRISADLAACERGNVLRLQVIAIGGAGQDMVQGVLDIVLPEGTSERVDQIRQDLQPILARHQGRVDEIKLTDCSTVVPGARPTTTEGNS